MRGGLFFTTKQLKKLCLSRRNFSNEVSRDCLKSVSIGYESFDRGKNNRLLYHSHINPSDFCNRLTLQTTLANFEQYRTNGDFDGMLSGIQQIWDLTANMDEDTLSSFYREFISPIEADATKEFIANRKVQHALELFNRLETANEKHVTIELFPSQPQITQLVNFLKQKSNWCALIELYDKKIISSFPTSYTFSCCLIAHNRLGQFQKTIDRFIDVRSDGIIKLDYIAYDQAFIACSHVGNTELMKELFSSDLQDNKVTCSVVPYTCLLTSVLNYKHANGRYFETMNISDGDYKYGLEVYRSMVKHAYFRHNSHSTTLSEYNPYLCLISCALSQHDYDQVLIFLKDMVIFNLATPPAIFLSLLTEILDIIILKCADDKTVDELIEFIGSLTAYRYHNSLLVQESVIARLVELKEFEKVLQLYKAMSGFFSTGLLPRFKNECSSAYIPVMSSYLALNRPEDGLIFFQKLQNSGMFVSRRLLSLGQLCEKKSRKSKKFSVVDAKSSP